MNINKENYSKIIDTCIQISSNFVKEEETKKKKEKKRNFASPISLITKSRGINESNLLNFSKEQRNFREMFGMFWNFKQAGDGATDLAFVFRGKQCRVSLQLWPISGFVPAVLDFPAWNMHCISIVLLPHKGGGWRASDATVL